MEIIIASLIVIASVYIFIKTLKSKSKGVCDCSSCSAKCPSRQEDYKGSIMLMDKSGRKINKE